MESPSVSVVVPVRDTVEVLPECLDSILVQTESDIEVLCVDDGSTDGSSDVLERYAAHDRRVTVIRRDSDDRGPGAGRNLAIERARGAYMAFVDSDDRVHPTFLASLVEAAERDGADVAMCMLRTFDADGEHQTVCTYDRTIPGHLDERAFTWADLGSELFRLRFASCNKIYARSYLLERGIRYGEDRYYEDLIFTFRSLLEASALTFVREPLYLNRKGRAGATTHSQGDRAFDALASFEDLREELEDDPAYADLLPAFHAFEFRKLLGYLPQNDGDHFEPYYVELRRIASRQEVRDSPHLSDTERAIRERIASSEPSAFLIWYAWYLHDRYRGVSRRLARAQSQRERYKAQVRDLREENRRLRAGGEQASRRARGVRNRAARLAKLMLGPRGTAAVRRWRNAARG